MKILHTSDWHIGHQLYGYDRTEEHLDVIRQIARIVREEKPDAMLLCGDVFHTSQPSASVQKIFVDAMLELRRACPGMKIVVTAGNHDSGSRHEVFSTPWRELGVEAIGVLRHQDEGAESHIIEIEGKGYIVALPYANERYIPEGYIQGLLDAVAGKNTAGLPVVLAAHTTVRGADYTGHEKAGDYIVGGIEGIDAAALGEGYDYVALGHIHKPQFVHTGRHNVRYSGSPLPVSFDEDYTHSVSVVEMESSGGRVEVRELTLETPMETVTLPKEYPTDWETALALLREFPADRKAYVRLRVESDGTLPIGANEMAQEAAKGKNCRYCYIHHTRRGETKHEEKRLTVTEFQEMNPIDVARRFFEEKGMAFDDDIREMFETAARAVEEDRRK